MAAAIRRFVPDILAIISGLVVWLVIGTVTESREAWDSGYYLGIGLPALALIVGVLAYFFPAHPGRLGVLPMVAQAVWMYATGPIGPFGPLGLMFFALLSMPCLLAADVGARFGRKRRQAAFER